VRGEDQRQHGLPKRGNRGLRDRLANHGARLLWVPDHLADVCIDLSRFHQVADVSVMDSAAFFCAAERLVFYEGAVTRAMRAELERPRQQARTPTLEELRSGADLAARDGWGPVFTVERIQRRE